MASKSVMDILRAKKGPQIQKPSGASRSSSPSLGLDRGWSVSSQTCLVYTPEPFAQPTSESQVKIAAFDMDHTLIRSKNAAQKFSRGPNDWVWLFPHVSERLTELNEEGYKILIFTNQAATVVGRDSKSMGLYTTKMRNVFAGLPVKIYAACRLPKSQKPIENKDFRKPSTGMWELALEQLGIEGRVDMESSFFVGDAAGRANDFSDSDKEFAHRAGLKFYTPEEYFDSPKQEPK